MVCLEHSRLQGGSLAPALAILGSPCVRLRSLFSRRLHAALRLLLVTPLPLQCRVTSNSVVALGCLPQLQTLALYETRVRPMAGEEAWLGCNSVQDAAPPSPPPPLLFPPVSSPAFSRAYKGGSALFAVPQCAPTAWPSSRCAVDKLLAANPDLVVQGVLASGAASRSNSAPV